MNLAAPLYRHRLIATPQTIQENERTKRMRTYIHVLSAIRTRKPNLQQAKSNKLLSSRGLCDQSARMRDTQYIDCLELTQIKACDLWSSIN